jgi:hypothetical protein
MKPEALSAWKDDLDLTDDEAAARLLISRRAFINYRTGERPIPDAVADLVRGSRPAVPKVSAEAVVAVVGVDAVITPPESPVPVVVPLPVVQRVAPAVFDPVAAKLKPMSELPPYGGQQRYLSPSPLTKGWQLIPGGYRVVSGRIPDPINYEAPAWAGWRGIVTSTGDVYDYETGMQMYDHYAAARVDTGPQWQNLK